MAETAEAQQPVAASTPAPCSEPEARQFDFWIGDWEVTWGEDGKGSNRIQATLGGCVILENFDARPTMPFQGMSVSTYSVNLGKWQQTWVDNEGNYLDFVGEFKDGQMILRRQTTLKGKPIWQRMVWYNIAADQLDWNWERSEDGGKTWTLLWKIHYTRSSRAAQSGQRSA